METLLQESHFLLKCGHFPRGKPCYRFLSRPHRGELGLLPPCGPSDVPPSTHVCPSPATRLIRPTTSSSVGVVTGLSTSSRWGPLRCVWGRFLRRTVDCLLAFSLGDCRWSSARYVLSVLVSSLSVAGKPNRDSLRDEEGEFQLRQKAPAARVNRTLGATSALRICPLAHPHPPPQLLWRRARQCRELE